MRPNTEACPSASQVRDVSRTVGGPLGLRCPFSSVTVRNPAGALVESGLSTPDTPGETGGLIVMVRPDPADAARAIAEDLRAELAIGGEATERAVERIHLRELEHRDLDGLAAAMRRAELIRDRTREAVSSRLSQSLNTRVAIHPDTLRRAAAELLAAQTALHTALRLDGQRTQRRRRVRRG